MLVSISFMSSDNHTVGAQEQQQQQLPVADRGTFQL